MINVWTNNENNILCIGRGENVMLQIGVQSKNIIEDTNPSAGFAMLKEAGFSCVDFSLNGYLTNTSL